MSTIDQPIKGLLPRRHHQAVLSQTPVVTGQRNGVFGRLAGHSAVAEN
jgi:hypothetical protein